MSEQDNSDEMVKINEYAPSPHRMTLVCERNSGVNAGKCSLPLEFRWNVTPHDLEQIWLLSENVIDCKYSWSLYKDILEKANLSLGVYTTVEAYREFVNAEMSTLRYRGKAKNKKKTIINKEHTKINDIDTTKPFDVHSEYLELPEYTDRYNVERVSRIRFELNKLIKPKSFSSSSSWSSLLLSPSYWGISSYLSTPVSRLFASLKRATDESKTTMPHAKCGSNEKSKECNESNDENAKYVVCVGFVTGRIGYASITVPNFDKAGRRTDVNQGLKIISLSTCKLCVNPTGYIGLVEILPKMQKCGLGSVMLQTYIQFMTHRMPLHANTYLHYDIHRMELLISRCQECTEPIHASKNNNDSKVDGNNNCKENSNKEEHNTCTENSTAPTTKSLVESDELCSLMDADTLNPVMQYGVREVWLHCLASEEKVVSFYNKNNFNEGKRCFNYYTYNENKKEALLMLYCTPAANTNATITKSGGSENTSGNQKKIVHKDGKYKVEVLQTIDEMPLDVSSLLLQEEVKESQKCEGTAGRHDMSNKKESAEVWKMRQNFQQTYNTKNSNKSYTSMNTNTRHFEWLTPSHYHAIHDVNIESTKKVRSEWLQAQNEQVTSDYGVAAVTASNNSISGGKVMSSKRVNGDMTGSKDAMSGNTWKDWLLCANALFLLASVLYCCYMSFTFRHDEIQVKKNNQHV